MSVSRQFSKALAVALNYDIPNLSSGDLSAIRSLAPYTATTVYDDFDFAHISPTRNGGYNTYSIYGISVHTQDVSDEDIIFKLYNNGAQVNNIQFTLTAGSSSAKLNDGLTTPVISGLDPATVYYIKCSQASAPTNKAQGVELTYFLHKV